MTAGWAGKKPVGVAKGFSGNIIVRRRRRRERRTERTALPAHTFLGVSFGTPSNLIAVVDAIGENYFYRNALAEPTASTEPHGTSTGLFLFWFWRFPSVCKKLFYILFKTHALVNYILCHGTDIRY